jgi:hypothetical protein
MRPALLRAARDLFVGGEELWVLLDEHQVYSRIPDLVAARIDLAALEERLAGGWLRALNETELRGLRTMRPDRGSRLSLLADRMRVAPDTARKVLGGLVRDGFAERTLSGSYARRAPIAPILSRVVSVEAKRSAPRAALVQAREHGFFADAVYVAFDAAFAQRFDAAIPAYKRSGIGLLALDADMQTHRLVLRPGRSPYRHVVALALAAERALTRLLAAPLRRLPESRLPSASGESGRQGRPLLVGPHASVAQQLLLAAGRSPGDPLPA